MYKKLFAGALIMLGLVLSGCAAQTETPTATEAPVETPTEVVVVSAPDSSECLACHTDKQQLIDTAKPEEADHEAESKGVG
jgi:hypothetical protein